MPATPAPGLRTASTMLHSPEVPRMSARWRCATLLLLIISLTFTASGARAQGPEPEAGPPAENLAELEGRLRMQKTEKFVEQYVQELKQQASIDVKI